VHFGEYLICLVIFILYCFYEIGLRDSWMSGYNFLFLHFHSHLCTFHAFWRIPCLPGYSMFDCFYEIGLRDSWIDFLVCIFILIYALSVHSGEYLFCLVIFNLYCFWAINAFVNKTHTLFLWLDTFLFISILLKGLFS